MHKIDVYVEPHYPLKKKVLAAAARAALEKGEVKGQVLITISIIGDRKMRQLNREYRQIDKTTDVLAFPYSFSAGTTKFVEQNPEGDLNLGDVVISYPQLLERAAQEDLLVDEMASFLVIHGVLHLLGFDHEKAEEASLMEPLEDSILSELFPSLQVLH
jgi:probable rRNA maturation factor